jgi:kynureninase
VELCDYRDRFPILAETTYLISHSLGAMPASAKARLAEYAHARGRCAFPSRRDVGPQ